ncbi:MAG: formylglycine-generating enzyme family protein [Bacteroidales bacterium]|nr:formylglycine-generating enzyme family protein [Bacteroidales bacterium]
MKKLLLIPVILLITAGCKKEQRSVTFPYSQWTVGFSGHSIDWHYPSDLRMNSSFISIPENQSWEEWYRELLAFRDTVRNNIGKIPPEISCTLQPGGSARIHFDKIGYDLDLKKKEKIVVNGKISGHEDTLTIYMDYDIKTKGEELSYVVRKKIQGTDSLLIPPGPEVNDFQMEAHVPVFENDSFSITPIMRIHHPGSSFPIHFNTGNISLKIPGSQKRKDLLKRVVNMIKEQAANNELTISPEFEWVNDNFVMGFAFIWDQDLYDREKGVYTVDHFCNKMQREFGGIQSVILWHSYPNLGIDNKNQFDMFEALPGGLAGLRELTTSFHNHGIKVFITYNPWDLDTRRPDMVDNNELARIIDAINADGIYLDTWKSSTGVISIFSVEELMREAMKKTGRSVAFSTEILPEHKDLIGKNALTCSWGQEIHPFHYTDLSLIKWLMPEHKQHFIKRMNKDRRRELSHAWINGQGIQIWENIFGTMNKWNSKDRQVLRKMNAIWNFFGRMYISDEWKPFLPIGQDSLYMSEWHADGNRIFNLVNASAKPQKFNIETIQKDTYRYFDIWNGKELKPNPVSGSVDLVVDQFGCILETRDISPGLHSLLEMQIDESKKILQPPARDLHMKEISIKQAIRYPYSSRNSRVRHKDLLKIEAGVYKMKAEHIWREGHCYPNMDARNNHDLNISGARGYQTIQHECVLKTGGFLIMARVVTNREYEKFLKESGYMPGNTLNYLKHWGSEKCPTAIKNNPVVWVSLEDARAYAEWAGMELPNEWDWQKAKEIHGEQFLTNEVFEWNESERSDGNNRFVTLRSGCTDWTMHSSWWYMPGAPYGKTVGGPQPVDSHVKYFLIYPGLDRAATIGFRCIANRK